MLSFRFVLYKGIVMWAQLLQRNATTVSHQRPDNAADSLVARRKLNLLRIVHNLMRFKQKAADWKKFTVKLVGLVMRSHLYRWYFSVTCTRYGSMNDGSFCFENVFFLEFQWFLKSFVRLWQFPADFSRSFDVIKRIYISGVYKWSGSNQSINQSIELCTINVCLFDWFICTNNSR